MLCAVSIACEPLAQRLQVKQQRDRLANLRKDHRTDAALALVDANCGHGTHVLALCAGWDVEPVAFIGIDDDLGTALTNGPGQRNNLNDIGPAVQNTHRRHHHGWSTQSGLAPRGCPEVQFDNVTRRQHRAKPSLPR